MNILIYHWNSYNQSDIEKALKNSGCTCSCFTETISNYENDDLFLITNVNTHAKYFKDFINPEDSLSNTCEGGHSHDHHEAFEINKNGFELKEEISPYHEYRYEFLKGYFDNSPYTVDLVGGINYRIYKK